MKKIFLGLTLVAILFAGVFTTAGAQSSTTNCYTFDKNLYVGSRGRDVKELQIYLNNNGFTVAVSGNGSPGNETTYFGEATKYALTKFQLDNSISPSENEAYGDFGFSTRTIVNNRIAEECQFDIRITSPSASDAYSPGDTITINYTMDGYPSDTKISLQLNKGAVYPSGPWNPVDVITGSWEQVEYVPASGSYKYTIPENIPSGDDYTVFLGTDYPNTEVSRSYWSDEFSIGGENSNINVVSPKAGDVWTVGETYRIAWDSFDATNNIYVYLISAGLTNHVATLKSGSTYFDYTVTTEDLIPEEGWQVHVCDGGLDLDTNCGVSDFVKIISNENTPDFTVTTPNGGEEWMLNSSHSIQWTPDPHATSVIAYLEKKVRGNKYETVGKVIEAGKGSIQWFGEIDDPNTPYIDYANYAPPSEKNRKGEYVADYYIRLENSVTGESDRSDSPFVLLPVDFMSVDMKIDNSDGPLQIDRGGENLEVAWTSKNADSCTFYRHYTGKNPITGLPSSGSMTVFFDENTYSGSVGVSMFCQSNYGSRNDYIEILPSPDLLIETSTYLAEVGEPITFEVVVPPGSRMTQPVNYVWLADGEKIGTGDTLIKAFNTSGYKVVEVNAIDSNGRLFKSYLNISIYKLSLSANVMSAIDGFIDVIKSAFNFSN